MREYKRKLNLKKSIILLVVILFVGLTIFLALNRNEVSRRVQKLLSKVGIYNSEVREVETTSSNYDDPGSFKIDKSFEWIDYKKLKVTYDLDSNIKTGNTYKDVILVLDISASMEGDRINKAKEDISELINYLLKDSNNSIALITFETFSTIKSNFTNNEEYLLQQLNSLTATGCTNYNAALLNVSGLMENYTYTNNREVITVFVTDGYPNEDTPNEAMTYEVLKRDYPYMTINGIQYEMGNTVAEELDNITDEVWVSNSDNFNNALFEAAVRPDIYDEFRVNSVVSDYFTIDSVKTDKGEVTTSGNNVTWNMDSVRAGASASMEIYLNIKDDYMVSQNYYPLSSSETITYDISNISGTINNIDSLVTKNIYDVNYNVNTPSGCSISALSSDEVAAFTNVTKKQNQLSCTGYLFKGFEVESTYDNDVSYINDDVLVMPGKDITLRGVWSRQAVVKKMDGTLKTAATLYKVLEHEASDNTLALQYTGEHKDSFNRPATKNIYHYYAVNNSQAADILDKNNVIFAGYCWQMIRTTDTGGVKMIYNGPAVNNQCLNTRGSGYEGFYSYGSTSLSSSSYYYGSDYSYDSTSGQYTLVNARNDIKWSTDSSTILADYSYTCRSSSTSCTTLYHLVSYDTSSAAKAVQLKYSSQYYQYGTLPYNDTSKSLSDVGYMYNNRYESTNINNMEKGFVYAKKMGESSTYNYYYSTSYSYNNSTGKYSLAGTKSAISWTTYKGYTSLTDKKRYTCLSTSSTATCDKLYYVLDARLKTDYLLLQQIPGTAVGNQTIFLSDGVIDNQDGTFTLDNDGKVEITRLNWYSDYSNYEHYYYCSDYRSSTCSGEDMHYIYKAKQYYEASSDGIPYLTRNKVKFGSGFRYENGKYILDGTTYDIWDYTDSTEQAKIATAHYTCFNSAGECSEVNYAFMYAYFTSVSPYGINLYYIPLSNNTSIEQAVQEMLYANDVNTYPSTMKIGLDWWYNRYLKNYANYIEETIFCNNRTISQLRSMNPDGGSITTGSLTFVKNSIMCANITDMFSTANTTYAKLDVSVGLISYSELNLLSNSLLLKTGRDYFTLSPHSYYDNITSLSYFYARIGCVDSNGRLTHCATGNSGGVRPAISLAPGTYYKEGDGSMASPYVVDTGQ